MTNTTLIRDSESTEQYLAQWDLIEPRGFETYREAARIFRAGRARGFALTTIDSLIRQLALSTALACSPWTKTSPESRIARLSLYRFRGRCCGQRLEV